MVSANGKIAIQIGGSNSRRVWRGIRRWHAATTVVGIVSWIVGIVAMLLGGGTVPALEDHLDDGTQATRRRRPDVTPAWLVLRRTSGWPRDRQVDLAKSFAATWRGPGAMAAGIAWLGDESLVWTPKTSWAQLGARGFGLHLDRTERIECTQVSRRSVGLTVRQSDASEVWLWLRSKDGERLIERLEA